MKKYIGAVDQGTTSTRFVIFNHDCEIVSMHQLEHRQIYPKPGWVEHDPVEIKNRTFEVIKTALKKAGITSKELSGIGITNQRETTIVWDPRTGDPYYNAIVWQDMRTDQICKDLAVNSDMDCYRHITGLPLATYFSGPKIKWIFDNTDGLRDAAVRGNVLFGNIDTWIIWWLTGGPDGGVHVTDVTNASRTMLMSLNTLDWDESMLDVLGIPEIILPVIHSSSEIYGHTKVNDVFNDTIPVSGDLGDQQAALFGQACFEVGEAKNTYGTGCFLLMNTGEKIVHSKQGLLTTVGYKIGKQPAAYALEGSIAMAGSLVQWLRDNLEFFDASADIETMAKSVPDNGGIYFVPAFSGLFAPHWRSDARGLIIGMTHYINKGHIARAAIEASAFQTKEIFDAMEKDSGIGLKTIKADGGMVVNEILMQFQSDILNIPVFRPKISETTVLGAAFAAGLATGFWDTTDELKSNWTLERKWDPEMSDKKRNELYNGWLKAVKRTYDWL
ncbi:MAG: glycerol kinase GlpK [Desulfobacterales bacterium]|jgi:glycerol kinase|nr:glycerol kinase GlpK [Desulfobacteraceae bacterium]MBT7084756.1 glycerol kinase GlpK [Desulfobacterales bacterium]MBT7697914.1 glycerol kinase GlpK [Desulfobacterales bacterium]